ncbi:MAG: phospho-N-acetylmuramoyl-pentapeptide-transferase [Rickettsiales bacterium]
MLYELYLLYGEDALLFNLFKYITFRSGGAVFTALFLALLFGDRFIARMKSWQQQGQPIRENGPQSHLATKKGTPTMGGLLILSCAIFSCLLWANLRNPYVWIALGTLIAYGALGFADDYRKVKKRNVAGVSGKGKLLFQFAVALAATLAFRFATPGDSATTLAFPILKDLAPDLGFMFFPFAMIVVVGASNAVNLTDGLDGLASMPVIIACGCFALIAYLAGNAIYANYLGIPHMPLSGEMTVYCSSIIGAVMGFLWFNAPPARIFMGDVGSLSLGGALGLVSVMTKHEIVLAIVGGLFVAEAVSVILQVYYYKFSGGKRIFRMAPLHHHFELKGWSETAVVIRFWIVAAIFALIGLSTLKIR